MSMIKRRPRCILFLTKSFRWIHPIFEESFSLMHPFRVYIRKAKDRPLMHLISVYIRIVVSEWKWSKQRTSRTTLSVPWAVGFAPAKKEKGEEIKKKEEKVTSHLTMGRLWEKGEKRREPPLPQKWRKKIWGKERERKRSYEALMMLLFYAVGHFLR